MALPQPQMPPSLLGQPPVGASPISVPTGNPGEQAAALSKVRAAIDMLSQILSKFPANTDPWKAVNAAITGLGKIAPPSAGEPKVQETTMKGLLGDAQKNAMMNMVSGSLGGGAGPAAGAPAPPAGAGMPAAA